MRIHVSDLCFGKYSDCYFKRYFKRLFSPKDILVLWLDVSTRPSAPTINDISTFEYENYEYIPSNHWTCSQHNTLLGSPPFECAFTFGIFHHHHYVPSVVNRSAVMDLHRSRSCATLIQSLYDIFVHFLVLSVHIVLGLPRPLLPFILPSISNRCTLFPLIICPKYWHFLFW